MLGDQIKTLRAAHRISQSALAKDLNVSKQAVSNWENNNIMPSAEMIRQIALYFSCTSDYLLEIEQPDADSFYIKTKNLQAHQITHIQQIVQDFEALNKAIEKDNSFKE